MAPIKALHAAQRGKPVVKGRKASEPGVSPSTRGKLVPNFLLEEDPATLERAPVEESFMRPPCRQSDYLYHLDDAPRTQWEPRPSTKSEARPPSRLHARIKGEYRLKDTCEGLRLEDVTGPDLEDFSDLDLMQTGPINFEFQADELEEQRSKANSRRSSGGINETEEMRRKMLSSTINSSLVTIPITLNKRKHASKPKRSSSRPPTSRVEESHDPQPIKFLAFSRVEVKQPSKKPPVQEAPRTRTTSALYRKGVNPVPPLKSSLEPEFLSLFAKADSSIRF